MSKIKIRDDRKSKAQVVYKLVPYVYVLLILVQEVLRSSGADVNADFFAYCVYGIAAGLIAFETVQFAVMLRKENTICLFPMLFYVAVAAVYAYLQIYVF